MTIRLPSPNESPAAAAAWNEAWSDFIHRFRHKGGSAADRFEAEGAAQYLLEVAFPEPTLSLPDTAAAVSLLMDLPDEACKWPAVAAYNQIRRLLGMGQASNRSKCRTFSEVHLVDIVAAGGLTAFEQELVLWLSRSGGLTPAEIKARNQWSDAQLAGFMARVVGAMMTA